MDVTTVQFGLNRSVIHALYIFFKFILAFDKVHKFFLFTFFTSVFTFGVIPFKLSLFCTFRIFNGKTLLKLSKFTF